ncbi:MAG: hypothetical protein GY869_17130 [Planctomycetes bacterium]|nr:hypothetical protein [Planctomycetota bacterium]
MIRNVFILTAVILPLFTLSAAAQTQIHSTWTGSQDNLWDNQFNWDPNLVPNNSPARTFKVTINNTNSSDDNIEFWMDWNPITLDVLYCSGEVDLEIGDRDLILLDPNGLTNFGDLEISGTGTEHDIQGNLINTVSGYIDNSSKIDIIGDLINYGQIINTPGSSLFVEYDLTNLGIIFNYNGDVSSQGILENTASGVLQGFGVIYSDTEFRNFGNIRSYGGPLVLASSGMITNQGVIINSPNTFLNITHIGSPADFNNYGTLQVNQGGGIGIDNNLNNQPAATIELRGGALTATNISQSPGAGFAGFGGITGDVLMIHDSSIQLTGPTNIVGDVTLENDANLQISDGQTLITGPTVNDGAINLIGGTVIFQGGYSGSGAIDYVPGIYRNHFDINADGIVNLIDFALFTHSYLWKAPWR